MSDVNSLLAKYQNNNPTDIVNKMSASYLPYAGVANGLSAAVQSGMAKPGHWTLTANGGIKSLGVDVDAIPCFVHMKALRTGDSVESSLDPDSDVFKKIASDAMGVNSGCMFGPEFLVYFPAEQQFATLFLGSKSGRRQAGAFTAMLGKSVKLNSELVKNAKGSWYVPKVAESATPHVPFAEKDLDEAYAKYKGPVASKEAPVTPEAAEAAGRAR